MSETKLATKADLKEMYDRMLPYLGGSADAGFTPVGTVISVMSNHAPANYLICDGTVYNIADYPELANHFLNEFGSKNYFGGNGTTTFAVPSLQGEFLRGAGTNSHAGQGKGANVGEHQDSTVLPDVMIANSKFYTRLINGQSYAPLFENLDSIIMGSGDTGIVEYKKEGQTSNYAKNTLRPTNTSVLYCIATKNIYLNPSNDYSTDEKVVGTWIDGKTLWQKTVVGTVTTYTDGGDGNTRRSHVFTPTIANIKEVIDTKGYVKNITTTAAGVPSSIAMGSVSFVGIDNATKANYSLYGTAGTNSTTIVLQTKVSYAITSVDFVITYQYTKTTD